MKNTLLRYIMLALVVMVVIGVFAGCQDQPSGAEVKPEQDSSIYTGHDVPQYDREAITVADFMKSFDTVDSLREDATLVIEGVVKNTSLHLHKVNEEMVPYTLFEVEVTKTLKGNVESGTVITVAEYGGIVTAVQAGLEKKFPDMNKSEKEERIFISFGNEPAKADQKLLLFLSNGSGYQILKTEVPYYMLVGEYNGKFIQNAEGSYVQSLPKSKNSTTKAIVVDDALSILG